MCLCLLALSCGTEVGNEVEERPFALYTGTHWPNGYVDEVGRQWLDGWACIDNYGEPMWVHIYDGTTYLGSTFADKDRPGLEWICGGQIRRQFYWAMPRLASGTHTINVYVSDSPTPKTVSKLPGANSVTFPAPLGGDSPIGYVESLSTTAIAGWACDRNVPSSPIDIHVYIQYDGAAAPVFLTGGTTTINRPDVTAICGSGVAKGFSIPLPNTIRGGLHNIVAYGINLGAGINAALNETSNVPNLVDFGCIPDLGPDIDAAPILQSILDAGMDVILCPGATFYLRSTHCMQGTFSHDDAALCFRNSGQMIASKLLPAGDGPDANAPVLKIAGDFTTAVASASSVQLDNVRLRNVVLDGNRNSLGYKNGGALFATGRDFPGSNRGMRIDHIKARDTRGWSSIHVGAPCSNVEVSYNKVEDAGCSRTRRGCMALDAAKTWADGISFGCYGQPNGSKIFRNTIENATDGGIVLFAPQGTEVFGNSIRAVDRELLGGINMVDTGGLIAPIFNPVTINGVTYSNFSGVYVHDNVIDAAGNTIDVGIAQGEHTWGGFCGAAGQAIALGGLVRRNTFKGGYFRWAAVLDWVDGWQFTGNVFAGTFSGASMTSRCGDGIVPPPSRICARAHHVNAYLSGSIQSECASVNAGETLHGALYDDL